MLRWLFGLFKSKSHRNPNDVIRIVVTRSKFVEGGYDYWIASVGGPSDVVCMTNDIEKAVEHILRGPRYAPETLSPEWRDLNNLLNHISYGAHFKLEYDGSSWGNSGVYGTWKAQFYNGFEASGGNIFAALSEAWNMLPNKPSPFVDSSRFTPERGYE